MTHMHAVWFTELIQTGVYLLCVMCVTSMHEKHSWKAFNVDTP